MYAIRCKHNNIHYIGESQNLKNRIAKHREQLEHRKTNKCFFEDFYKYGPEGFELIIVTSGSSMIEFKVRLELQSKLQSILNPLGFCYNTGCFT